MFDTVPAVLPRVRVSSARSTSLMVEWDGLSAQEARGVITRQQIVYRRHGSSTQRTVDLPGDVTQHVITGLLTTYCFVC